MKIEEESDLELDDDIPCEGAFSSIDSSPKSKDIEFDFLEDDEHQDNDARELGNNPGKFRQGLLFSWCEILPRKGKIQEMIQRNYPIYCQISAIN